MAEAVDFPGQSWSIVQGKQEAGGVGELQLVAVTWLYNGRGLWCGQKVQNIQFLCWKCGDIKKTVGDKLQERVKLQREQAGVQDICTERSVGRPCERVCYYCHAGAVRLPGTTLPGVWLGHITTRRPHPYTADSVLWWKLQDSSSSSKVPLVSFTEKFLHYAHFEKCLQDSAHYCRAYING